MEFLGLASFGFWMFVAAAAVGGIWDGVRKREAEHETLRRIIESGKPIDEALIDQIMGNNKRPDQDLKIAGLIVICVAPGLVVLGYFVGAFEELIGVAGLVAFVGIGLLSAAKFADNAWKKAQTEKHQRLG